MRAKIISLPTKITPAVPSVRQQYMDLAAYFEGEGDVELAKFYRTLALEY